jgi:hypothetical protein
VEYEHSISAAVNRLRQAMGDSAENPQFIETLARRGSHVSSLRLCVSSQRQKKSSEYCPAIKSQRHRVRLNPASWNGRPRRCVRPMNTSESTRVRPFEVHPLKAVR